MTERKTVKNYKWIPFKTPQSMPTYMKLQRSNNPLEKALELQIVDLKELRKRNEEINKIFKKLGILNILLFSSSSIWFICSLFFLNFKI